MPFIIEICGDGMEVVLKIISVALFATVKYIFTLPYALFIGLSYQQSILSIIVGGTIGFIFFYYMNEWLLKLLKRFKLYLFKAPEFGCLLHCLHDMWINRRRRIFTRKSRLIVRMKSNYGLLGLIIATPVLLSIPFGAFLAKRYFSQHKMVPLYMSLSITGWSAILTGGVLLLT